MHATDSNTYSQLLAELLELGGESCLPLLHQFGFALAHENFIVRSECADRHRKLGQVFFNLLGVNSMLRNLLVLGSLDSCCVQ